MRTKSTLISLAVAFAAGAVAGVLIAPDKGERTRRRIGRNYRALVNKVDGSIEEGRDYLEELKDEIREQLEIIDEKMQQYSCR